MRHKDPELMNRIKQYISEYYLENAGAMPTITEIAHAMEIVHSTAYTYLVSMDRQELIRYQDGKISVRELDKILVGSEQVDAVGEINCGEPALEEANLLYRTSLPTAIFGKGPFYILKAKGDSMVDAGIESGDTLPFFVYNHTDCAVFVIKRTQAQFRDIRFIELQNFHECYFFSTGSLAYQFIRGITIILFHLYDSSFNKFFSFSSPLFRV